MGWDRVVGCLGGQILGMARGVPCPGALGRRVPFVEWPDVGCLPISLLYLLKRGKSWVTGPSPVMTQNGQGLVQNGWGGHDSERMGRFG